MKRTLGDGGREMLFFFPNEDLDVTFGRDILGWNYKTYLWVCVFFRIPRYILTRIWLETKQHHNAIYTQKNIYSAYILFIVLCQPRFRVNLSQTVPSSVDINSIRKIILEFFNEYPMLLLWWPYHSYLFFWYLFKVLIFNA